MAGRLEVNRLPGGPAMDAAQPANVREFVGREVPGIGLEHQRVFDSQVGCGRAGAAAGRIPAPRLVAEIDMPEISQWAPG